MPQQKTQCLYTHTSACVHGSIHTLAHVYMVLYTHIVHVYMLHKYTMWLLQKSVLNTRLWLEERGSGYMKMDDGTIITSPLGGGGGGGGRGEGEGGGRGGMEGYLRMGQCVISPWSYGRLLNIAK